MKKNKITIHQLVWYLLIFSIIGLIIETIYCFVTTGVLESRKGLILGPVCPIYGVGAIFIIVGLNRFKGNIIKLFIYGGFLGSIVEYIISFILEAIYGTRFWDYTYTRTSYKWKDLYRIYNFLGYIICNNDTIYKTII